MLTGTQALSRLSETLTKARGQLGSVDGGLMRAANKLTVNQRHQAEVLRQLARLRLSAALARESTQGEAAQSNRALRDGASVDSALNAAEKNAVELVARRDQEIERLERAVAEAEQALAALERERDQAHAQVDEAALRLAQLEAAVQQQLNDDEGYQAALERSRQFDRVAELAKSKAERARVDRVEKGKPFEDDPLFSYLWARDYGEAGYAGRRLGRMLDAWVARLCGYQQARPTYWTLLEIPKRLAEHAEAEAELADAQLDALAELESAAVDASGLPAAAESLAALEQEQEAVDARIEAQEQQSHALDAELEAFASGSDPLSVKAVEQLAQALARSRVDSLLTDALNTAGLQDDALIAQLNALREDVDNLHREVAEQKQIHRRHANRVKELEGVRRQFKQSRFDDLRSAFTNEQNLMLLLSEFLGGAVSGDALWDAFRRNQRYHDVGGARPDFGSGGLGRKRSKKRRRRRTPWHMPGGSRGGFRLPGGLGGGSRGGGGGFRTGGGF